MKQSKTIIKQKKRSKKFQNNYNFYFKNFLSNSPYAGARAYALSGKKCDFKAYKLI
jgi:hypothetical protein